MKKKKIIISIFVILLIIAIVTALILFFRKRAKYVYEIEEVSHIEYQLLNVDDRYGVINGKGEVIIEPNYDIIQIPNPSVPLFICMSNYNTETKEYDTKVLNDRKEQILLGYTNVQAIPTETTADGVPFEKTVLKYKKDGKFGLINRDGKEITEPIYDDISAVKYKEGMLLVMQDGKYGVINMNGVEVIPPEYDTISVDNYYNVDSKYQKTGFIVCKKEENGYRYGYINYKGDIVLPVEYTDITRVTETEDDDHIYLVAYQDGQAGLLRDKKKILNFEYESIEYNAYNDVYKIQRNGKQGVVDKDGNIKIEPQYTTLSFAGIYLSVTGEDGTEKIIDLNGNEATDGYIYRMPTKDGNHSIVYGEDETYKIIDNSGNVAIDKNYTYIEELDNNYYIVASYNNNGIIDLSGKSSVELRYSSIFKLDNTDLLQANISSTNTISLINSSMQVVATMDNAGIDVEDNYVRLYSEAETKYFDYQGNELTAEQVFPNNTLFAKKIDDKWGFVDKEGNVQVQNEYDAVTEFNEYGFAGIKVGNKWGVINSAGEIVQEPIYELQGISPNFIGKYYQSEEWYGEVYFTDKVEE